MKIGKSETPIYWHSELALHVIKIGQNGDNFGYVQCVATDKEFKTYGYNSLPCVGKLITKTVIEDIKLF